MLLQAGFGGFSQRPVLDKRNRRVQAALRPFSGSAFGISSVMNRFLTFAEGIPVAPPVQTDWTFTWLSVFGLAAALIAVSYGTRVGVIARATTKEAIRQPLFLLLLAISSIVCFFIE